MMNSADKSRSGTRPEENASYFRQVEYLLQEVTPIKTIHGYHDRLEQAPCFDMHYVMEVGVILEGRMQRYGNGEWVSRSAGGIWFCGVWEPHGFKVEEAPCECMVLIVHPPFLAGLDLPEVKGMDWLAPFSAAPSLRPDIPELCRDEVIALARQAMNCQSDSALDRVRLRGILQQLILIACEDWDGRQKSGTRDGEELARIRPALQLILSSRQLVTNDCAAKACNLSRDCFIRLFRRIMGVSFSRFSLRHRLSGAATALRATDQPIKAIATDWGFSNPSHLHRLFLKHYNTSPLGYRMS